VPDENHRCHVGEASGTSLAIVIVDSAVYSKGARVHVGCAVHDYADLRAAAREPHDFVWVGLADPTPGELDDVAKAFGLHPLAVEDALNAHQRPKVDRYDGSLFITLRTVWYIDEQDAVETGEINMFVGPDYVVTVRHGEGSELHTRRVDLESDAKTLGHGPFAVVYTVCDRVVDDYEAVATSLTEDVDEVEGSVFSPDRTNDSVRIYALKREIAEMRRAVLPLKEPMRQFAEGRVEGIGEDARPFFADVYDHVARTAEVIDGLDNLLTAAFQGHLARISVQQNEDMRKISAGVALFAVPTLIAGVYGMNFDHMPELRWQFGYAYSLGLMVAIAAALWAFFKKSGWL
jgi:magnesium transporter